MKSEELEKLESPESEEEDTEEVEVILEYIPVIIQKIVQVKEDERYYVFARNYYTEEEYVLPLNQGIVHGIGIIDKITNTVVIEVKDDSIIGVRSI